MAAYQLANRSVKRSKMVAAPARNFGILSAIEPQLPRPRGMSGLALALRSEDGTIALELVAGATAQQVSSEDGP